MEKNSYKVVAVFALAIAVVSLAIGFASYSATLTIENASATATATDTFSPKMHYKAGTMSCVKTGSSTVVQDAGSFENDTSGYTTIWKDAAVTLAGPGDSITCTATIQNESQFTAYLKEIRLERALQCNAVTGTVQNLNEACAEMNLTVNAGSASATANSTAANSNSSVTGVSIAANGEADVSFTIAYSTPANAETSAVADGDFRVSIPKISFLYTTVQ